MKKERVSTEKAMFSPYFQHSLFFVVLLLFQLIHIPEARADVSGTVYADEGVTTVGAGKTVRLLVNGVSQGTSVTDVSGNYSISNSAGAGDAMLVYIDGDATYAGTTVTVSNGASLTGIDIYADHVITRQDNGGSLTIAAMDAAKGAYVNAGILYSVAAGALTVAGANTTLYVPAGHTFAPAGNVNTMHVRINGTYDAQNTTITAGGNWNSNTGTFTPGTSSVVLIGTGNLDSTGDAFYNLTVGAATHTTTITSNLTVNNVLTIAAPTGTLTDGSAGYAITLPGGNTPFVNNGAAVSANRFIYGNINSSTVFVAGGTYNVTDKLWITGGNAGAGTPYRLNGSLTVNGKLDVSPTTTGILSLNTSVSNYNITANGLTISSSFFFVGFFYANGSTIDINGDVLLIDTVVSGIDLGSSHWTVSGNWTSTMTTGFLAQTSTVEFDGTAQTISGNTTFYNIKKTVTSADTLLTFAAGSSQTIKGTVTLNGTPGQLLSLRSSTPGTRWNFIVNAGATKAIDYVAVKDSDASGSDGSQIPVNPTNSINLGNTVSWFPESCPIVTNTNDTGSGSLRACITYANAHPGTTIRFNIPGADPGKQTAGADTWWRIIPLTSLPTITANNTIIDGTTQAVFIGGNPNTLGSEIQLYGNGASFNGLDITSASNTVKGLIIGGFSGGNGCGIFLSGSGATGNIIAGNYLGTDYSGTAAQANYRNIWLYNGANANTIGGTTAADRNVISGATNGFYITETGTDNNIIRGNYIGTNAAGTAALGNQAGIYIYRGAKSTIIGGAIAGAGNVISGNTIQAINIYGNGTDSHIIQGNYIGTNAAGTAAVPNAAMGIWISGTAKSTTIGGTDPLARNVISGNTQYGIFIEDAGTTNHVIQGNYIGLAADGATKIANSSGIYIRNGAASNTIGGAVANAGNVISGNNTYGIHITGAGADNSSIQGNYIGTDPAGLAAIPNANAGVYIDGNAKSTIIGDIVAGAANRIAYNGGDGISVSGVDTDGHIFSANSIFMNTGVGIKLAGDGSNNNKAAPTITAITPSGSDFIITATVPAAGDTIQFFRANNIASPAVIPDSPSGEGYLFLGSCVDNGGACVGPYVSGADTNATASVISVTLSGGGLTVGDTLSATATDAINGTSAFAVNKTLTPLLKLIKQTYDASGFCIASSDATDAGCGSTSAVTVPAGMVVSFMIIVKNTSAQNVTDIRFQDVLDVSATGFSYIPGSMFSTPLLASAPTDTASNAALYSAATNTLSDGTGVGDVGSAQPVASETISIGLPGNDRLDVNAHKSFAVIFQARKK